MGVLAEYVRKEAEHIRDERKRRAERLTEWTVAVAWLYARLEQWLQEADSGTGLLTATRPAELCREEYLLGGYSIPGLRITLGGADGRWAELRPKARHVGEKIKIPGDGRERRADGLVELWNDRFATDYLFRLAGATVEGDRWFIRDVDGWNTDPVFGRVEELTQDRFEAAALRALG